MSEKAWCQGHGDLLHAADLIPMSQSVNVIAMWHTIKYKSSNFSLTCVNSALH